MHRAYQSLQYGFHRTLTNDQQTAELLAEFKWLASSMIDTFQLQEWDMRVTVGAIIDTHRARVGHATRAAVRIPDARYRFALAKPDVRSVNHLNPPGRKKV